jgi:hypothetical protein
MNTEKYDSTDDTLKHILQVRQLLYIMQNKLEERGFKHDQSKLKQPEKEIFDEMTPKLKALTYGSPEYKASLSELGVALKHHYENNSHHPEHHKSYECNICFHSVVKTLPNVCPKCGNPQFTEGFDVAGMTLLDLVEMFCDWKAATERHADGDFGKSITINSKRFKLSDQLSSIIHNTKLELGW